ncbi:MAG: amidohydrolase family protein [bacterium]|nr:amidohydrolase family protein [bacterium]
MRKDPQAQVRLEGLTWYDGCGGSASTAPLGLAQGRYRLAPPQEWPAIQLAGWTMLPGLCDAHQHLFHQARRSLRTVLAGIKSRSEVGERLRAASAGGPVIGVEWDESEWDDQRAPTRAELDELFPDRPAILIRICGHVVIANSIAMEALPVKPEREAAESGYFTEEDVLHLSRPYPTDRAALLAATRERAAELARQGLTAVTEMGARDLPELAAALEGDFPLRMGYFHAGPVEELPAEPQNGPIRALGRKFFLDGSLGGCTAALGGQYLAGGAGELIWGKSDLCRALEETFSGGWQAAIHVIGDRAVEQALNCLESVQAPAGSARLEHLEMVRPGHLERIAQLGCGVCFQPNFMDRWGRQGGLYEQRLGADFRSMFVRPGEIRKAGVRLAYGTDGMPPLLWPALRSSVDDSLFSGDADSPRDALAAVAGTAAMMASGKSEYGGIKEGLAADFCLVQNDPVAENFKEKPVVALTVMGGRPTWLNTTVKDG